MVGISIIFAISILLNVGKVFGYFPGHPDNTIILNSKTFGASCSPIKYTPNSKLQASISLEIEEAAVAKKDSKKDLKIPVLIFRYTDILNFTSIPPVDEYFYDYEYFYGSAPAKEKEAFLKDLVNFDQNKFILNLEKGNKLHKDRIFNDYITPDPKDTKHSKATLPIYESGVYCVYIAPPTNIDIKELTIPLNYQNSYGYLPYTEYLIYTQYKYIIAIGLVLAGYLFNYILNVRVGKDFKNLNSISIISKAVIFYLLVPIVLIFIATWFVCFIQNRYVPSGRHAGIFKLLKMTLTWAEYNYLILLRFFLLLFAMGYGVIYYHNNGHKNYRELPARSMNKAVSLLIINVGMFSVREFLDYFGESIQSAMYGAVFSGDVAHINPHLNLSFIFIIHQVLNIGCEVFPFIWFVITLVHYFKTKKTIAKFPPLSTDSDESINANERVLKSFRQSILIIFVLPIVLGFILGFIIAYHMINSHAYDFDGFDFNGRESIALLVLEIKALEILTFDKFTILPAVWISILNVYLIIILLYVIWIRNNNGLAMDDGNGGYERTGGEDLFREEL